MNKTWWRYGLIGAGLYLAFLVLTVPASRVYPMLQAKLGTLSLQDIHGTLWRGTASSARVAGQRLDSLSWDVQLLPLLLLRAQAELDFRNDAGPGHLVATRGLTGAVYFDDIKAGLSADTLTALLNIPGVKVGGQFDLDVSELSIDGHYLSFASGQMNWRQAAMMQPWQLNLGDLQGTLETTKAGIQLTITDKGGALQANSVLVLKPDGEYQFTGTFASRDPRQPELERVLRFLGQPGPDGRILIAKTGRVPPVR